MFHTPVIECDNMFDRAISTQYQSDIQTDRQTDGIIITNTHVSDADLCKNSFVSVWFVVAGVYLCKHADILQPLPFHNGDTGYLVIFKILKVNLRSCMLSKQLISYVKLLSAVSSNFRLIAGF